MNEIDEFDKILISPGPGIPSETINLIEIIEKYHKTKTILGICLGHQAIAEYFGATLINVSTPFHGIKSRIYITKNDSYIFNNIPSTFHAGRYHSWVVSAHDFPGSLKITAISDDGFIMAISHRSFDVQGIQFHPESIMTPHGKLIIQNWLNK